MPIEREVLEVLKSLLAEKVETNEHLSSIAESLRDIADRDNDTTVKFEVDSFNMLSLGLDRIAEAMETKNG